MSIPSEPCPSDLNSSYYADAYTGDKALLREGGLHQIEPGYPAGHDTKEAGEPELSCTDQSRC